MNFVLKGHKQKKVDFVGQLSLVRHPATMQNATRGHQQQQKKRYIVELGPLSGCKITINTEQINCPALKCVIKC